MGEVKVMTGITKTVFILLKLKRFAKYGDEGLSGLEIHLVFKK